MSSESADPLAVAQSEIAANPQAVAWRPSAWCGEPYFNPPMPMSTFYLEVNRGLIDIVKLGWASWVTTTHHEYLRRRQAFNDAKNAA